ncbi:MAG TPA: nuclear transport factor 2 family protein [Solirubrobacterales bacterium]|nr:nuclear transport factor 2 family protein [Solirubrobacterales bacterium]
MSRDNVELMREGLEAFERDGVEALLDYIHPEFEVTTPPSLSVEPDTYRGHDGVRRYFDSFYEVMDEVRFVPEEFIEVGDRVVIPLQVVARGRETGIEATQRVFQVWSARDGKAIRVEVFPTREEAIAAAQRSA